MQVVRRAKVHSCGDEGVDLNATAERSLSPQDIGAVILGCTTVTYNESITNTHFGLPHNQIKYAERIEEGLPIFVFNFSEREMHGIFQAVSGTINVDPHFVGNLLEFTNRPTFHAARVCVRARKDFPVVSLPESVFRETIIDNYYSYTRFYFELDHKQADELVDLFTRKAIMAARQISKVDETGRSSAPHTDVHVVHRETFTYDNVVPGKYYVPAQYGRCGLQGESDTPKKSVAQNLYDWDDYSTSLYSKSFSFSYTHDQHNTGILSSLKGGYEPLRDDAITFRLEKVGGKDTIEAGTFSFHSASQAFMSSSDIPRLTAEDTSTNNAVDVGKIADATKPVPISWIDNKNLKTIPQPVENGDPGIRSQHFRQGEGSIPQSAAIERTIFFPLRNDKVDEQQYDGREERVSLCRGEDECGRRTGEGYLSIGPEAEEVVHQPGDTASGCNGREQAEPYTHHSATDVQETSISLERGSASDEANALLKGMKRFQEDREMPVGPMTSQTSPPESICGTRALSRGNYGAMFSWASDVTRFLSWRGHTSRNAERRECRQFLGKLRRLKIMRDESQARALVHQIQVLRVKSAEEAYFYFGESCEPVNEHLPEDSIDKLEKLGGEQPSSQDTDQSLIISNEALEQDEEEDIPITEPNSPSQHDSELDGSGSPQKIQEEVRLWRSEWLKEAKWRLEDYEHMQNTMFLLENARRLT